MKHYFALFVIPFVFVLPATGFYSLSYTRLDGTSIPCSTLQGKKVVLFPFKGTGSDWGMLQAVDSLQKLHPDSLSVIAFPALDFDSAVNLAYMQRVHDSLGLGLSIARPGYVTKSAGQAQLQVFQWLTTMTLNTHFNRDVEADGQLFVVSGKGTLYSVIEKASYPTVLPMVLTRKVWGE